jgi:hypothetical protein
MTPKTGQKVRSKFFNFLKNFPYIFKQKPIFGVAEPNSVQNKNLKIF